MKVFGCRCDMSYGGGLILVAANNVEEAFLTATMDNNVGYMFDWADDDGIWCEPDGKINHCRSDTYPLEKWFEAEHLSTDLTEPQVILEESYYEQCKITYRLRTKQETDRDKYKQNYEKDYPISTYRLDDGGVRPTEVCKQYYKRRLWSLCI